MPEEQPQQPALAEALDTFLKNTKLTTNVMSALKPTKPKGWARRSQAPYYKEVYAIALKAVIDNMIASREDMCWYFEEYEKRFSVSRDTLYHRINQSRRYLMDCLDPDDYYKKFFETVEICRERNVGIIIRFKPEFRGTNLGALPSPARVIAVADRRKWELDLDYWLENTVPGDAPFHKEGIALTPQEIEAWKVKLAPLGNSLMKLITSHEIKLVKVNLT